MGNLQIQFKLTRIAIAVDLVLDLVNAPKKIRRWHLIARGRL
jgi:hypothetical protein